MNPLEWEKRQNALRGEHNAGQDLILARNALASEDTPQARQQLQRAESAFQRAREYVKAHVRPWSESV